MTNIPSVEALAKDWLFAGDEPGEEDVLVYEEFKEFLTQALTDQRTALLTELRNSELLEEDSEPTWGDGYNDGIKIGHNTVVKAIKAHLDELIN